MKLFEHKIGRFTIRCQFEDRDEVKKLMNEFVPAVLFHLFKYKEFNPETTELPVINGAGFFYKKKTLTVFGEDDQILFIDDEGMRALADKIPQGEG